jgi:hypothetical protein
MLVQQAVFVFEAERHERQEAALAAGYSVSVAWNLGSGEESRP